MPGVKDSIASAELLEVTLKLAGADGGIPGITGVCVVVEGGPSPMIFEARTLT